MHMLKLINESSHPYKISSDSLVPSRPRQVKKMLHNYLSGPESITLSESQWDWLEDTLRSSTAHYLIVGGHYPVWSIAEHGPTKCLVDRLRPLLQKYNVTAYISGHDHNLQVIIYHILRFVRFYLLYSVLG